MAGAELKLGVDSAKAVRDLETFKKRTQSIAKSIAKGFTERVGHKLFDGLLGAARQVPDIMMDAVKSASSLNEEIGKSQAIFGDSAESIRRFSKTTADGLGLSGLKAMQATGQFGNLLRVFGVAEKDAADMSISLVKLASDMASFNDASIEDTVFAIGAALRGEMEPIRKFGVSLDQATLKQEALKLGLYDGVGALDANTKALASYSAIMKQTQKQQGNFAATADGLANSTKILEARISELKTGLGEKLLPMFEDFVNKLNEMDTDKAANGIERVTSVVLGLAEALGTVIGFFADLFDKIESIPGMDAVLERAKGGTAEDVAKVIRGEEPTKEKEGESKKAAAEEAEKAKQDAKIKAEQEELFRIKQEEISKIEEKRKATTALINADYREAVELLKARVRGDEKYIEQQKKKMEIAEIQNEFAKEDIKLSEQKAAIILKGRKAAERAEKKRTEDKAKSDIAQEYKDTMRILEARIKGDKKLLEQEEKRKSIKEVQERFARDGVTLSKEEAENIVEARKQAEEAEAKRAKDEDDKKEKQKEAENQLKKETREKKSQFEGAMGRSSIRAVSSMQAIGGGGGVSGELNLQKTQADLLRQLVELQSKGNEAVQETNKGPLTQ